ncbi:unnamed protein product, partial [Ectocarpus fasciculatus]
SAAGKHPHFNREAQVVCVVRGVCCGRNTLLSLDLHFLLIMASVGSSALALDDNSDRTRGLARKLTCPEASEVAALAVGVVAGAVLCLIIEVT